MNSLAKTHVLQKLRTILQHVKLTLKEPVRVPPSRSLYTLNLGSDKTPNLRPLKAAIFARITRYEFEKKRFKAETEEELQNILDHKRSDYHLLKERHDTHYKCVDFMKQSLENRGIETRVLNRLQLTQEVVDWADVVFTAGGDGTFLLVASKINDRNKPVIGINTDPTRSEGRLCLPKEEYAAANFEKALERLLAGDFKWKWRQRIRITMSGYHASDEPIELHDQQLQYLEHRYVEHVQEHEQCRHNVDEHKNALEPRVLPVLALNEVFFGESLSARVSYYELSVDDGPGEKQKSSGVTVCTGTGSSSWYFHINHLRQEDVKKILDIANKQSGIDYQTSDDEFLQRVTQEFNDALLFDPSDPGMAYAVRDPLINGVFHVSSATGLAKKIQILSRMWDACLVIDGGSSFSFNDGAIATLEIHDEDALRTVEF